MTSKEIKREVTCKLAFDSRSSQASKRNDKFYAVILNECEGSIKNNRPRHGGRGDILQCLYSHHPGDQRSIGSMQKRRSHRERLLQFRKSCYPRLDRGSFYLFSVSVASATASKSASWNGLPIHCKPTGRPPAIPHGTLTPGRPARFKLTV